MREMHETIILPAGQDHTIQTFCAIHFFVNFKS